MRSPPPPEAPRQQVLIRRVHAVVPVKAEETDTEDLADDRYAQDEEEPAPPAKRRLKRGARITSEDEEENVMAPAARKSRHGRSTSRSRHGRSAPPTEDEGDDEDELAPLSGPVPTKHNDPRLRRVPGSPAAMAKKRRPTATKPAAAAPAKRRAGH